MLKQYNVQHVHPLIIMVTFAPQHLTQSTIFPKEKKSQPHGGDKENIKESLDILF